MWRLNMKNRILFMLLSLLSFVPFCAATQDTNENPAPLFDMHEALKKVDRHFPPLSEIHNHNICIGEWHYNDNNCSTSIQCFENGSMTITYQNLSVTITWKGNFTSTNNQIVFTPVFKETVKPFNKKEERTSGKWILRFKLNGNGIIITSDDLPDALNGHDFSDATQFFNPL